LPLLKFQPSYIHTFKGKADLHITTVPMQTNQHGLFCYLCVLSPTSVWSFPDQWGFPGTA